MFSKCAITLSALLIFGGTSFAIVAEDPENKIGDRYPLLEKIDRTFANPGISAQHAVKKNAKLAQFTDEDVENKIADRYPFLEQISPVSTQSKIVARVAAVRQNARLPQFTNEEPESKIADRYPFLEQTVRVATATPARAVTRMSTSMAGAKKASLARRSSY
jgi:hypothetical protein